MTGQDFKMNFDEKIKAALGKGKKKTTSFSGLFNKKTSSSNIFNKPTLPKMRPMLTPMKKQGASLAKQKQWKSFSPIQRNMLRRRLPDTDGDRVPDRFDCSPRNVMKQDSGEYQSDIRTYDKTKRKEMDKYFAMLEKEDVERKIRDGEKISKKDIKKYAKNQIIGDDDDPYDEVPDYYDCEPNNEMCE
jgi:hypothetical protein